MRARIIKAFYDNIHFPILLLIVLIGIMLRWFTAGFDVILDYDPWWFYRHAVEIYEGGFQPPTWDIVSYYPPGRPVDYYLGWSYTLAVMYAIVSKFTSISLMQFSGYFVAIFAALSAVPAYFVGKMVTNRWGGLFTAFFAIATPTFLAVSMAGYPDSDATDVFYSFLAIAGTLFAIKKSDILNFSNKQEFKRTFVKYLPYVAPAVLAYWLFALNWSSSWYIYFIFLLFVPLLIVARIIEGLWRKEGKIGLPIIVKKIRDHRNILFATILIGVLGEIVSLGTSGWPLNTIPPHQQLTDGLRLLSTSGTGVAIFVAFTALYGGMVGLAFGRMREIIIGAIVGIVISILLAYSGVIGEAPLIVNISVAELQILNPFSVSGLQQIFGRIGVVPVTFALIAFGVTAIKVIKRSEVHMAEYFAIMWMIISLFLISYGIRFSLLFSIATATAAGFTIGNIIEFVTRRKSHMWLSTFAGIIIIAAIIHLTINYQFGQSTGGLEVSDNWKAGLSWLRDNGDQDSLVVTWWDPGHIITGFTGLKVHADGAHCSVLSCQPYDHNIRIQDMGRIFATSDKNEALDILGKYRNLDGQACLEAKKKFGDEVPDEACRPVKDMYLIASNDLIGKYYWLSFFGTGNGNNYVQMPFTRADERGNLVYGGGIVTLTGINNQIVALVNSPDQGIRNAVVTDIVLYQNGQEVYYNYGNYSNKLDGLVYVDPSFGSLIYMNPPIRDSIFTQLYFFNGRGLEDSFELVFSNPEMKIYRVIFPS